MFVRVQREDSSTLYECGKADLLPNDQRNKIALQMEGVPELGAVGSIIHKGKASVYFMNNDGQTIDAYDWPVQDTGKDDENENRIYTGDAVEVLMVDASSVNRATHDKEWRRGRVKRRAGYFGVELEDTDRVGFKALESIPSDSIRIAED
jgi:hypothetical protein